MRRFLPRTLNQCLIAAIPLALLLAWLTGHWLLGAAVTLGALCVLAARATPEQLAAVNSRWSHLRHRGDRSAESEFNNSTTVVTPAPPPRRRPEKDSTASLARQMIAQGRVALLLRPQIASTLSPDDYQAAQDALDEAMAMVPVGAVAMRARCHEGLEEEKAHHAERLIHVEGLFLDRYAVTNRDYLEFVEDGGYEQMELWDESIWPAVLGFVDRTGQPGPRYWENSVFPHGKDDHPVVGVTWYEAAAYARWAGKRLPSDAEWVKAACWPVFAEAQRPVQRKFPWGDSMDRRRANIWGSGHDGTIPVQSLAGGASVNGVHQLVGNVWEWTSGSFGAWELAGRKVETSMPLKSIRGGAFDTYFETQAHSQFQSGESPLARKHNIGFRCAVGFCDVAHMNEAASPQPAEEAPVEPEEVLA